MASNLSYKQCQNIEGILHLKIKQMFLDVIQEKTYMQYVITYITPIKDFKSIL